MANDSRIFENGLKIEKLAVVPKIGPMLLKQLKTALVTIIRLLLSKLMMKIRLSNIMI